MKEMNIKTAPKGIVFCFLLVVVGLVILTSNPPSVSANNDSPENTLGVTYSSRLDNLNLEVGTPENVRIYFNSTWNEKLRVQMWDNSEGSIRVECPPRFYIQPNGNKTVSFRVNPQLEGNFNIAVSIRVSSSHIAPGKCCVHEIIHEENILLKGNTILPPDIVPPNADANGPYLTGIGEELQLDGTRSSDSDGTIERYRWIIKHEMGGGRVIISNSDTATPSLFFNMSLKPGTQVPVKLVVVDNSGAADTDTTTVTFHEEENEISENVRAIYYIYGASTCASCMKVKGGLTDIYGENSIKFFDTNESPNGFYFNDIYDEAFPNKRKLEPVVGVFKENNLVAVVGGEEDEYLKKSFWEHLKAYSTTVACYEAGKKKVLTENKAENIADYFFQETETRKPQVSEILIPVIIAALADSVNPCTFAVFIVLLTIVGFRKDKSNLLKTGLSFVLAVYIMYFLMGFGLRPVFSFFPQIKYVVGAFGMFVGLLEISDFLFKHGISLVPSDFQKRSRSRIKKAASPKGAFVGGLAVSIFLLPCTSGPYFIAINFIAEGSLLEGIPLLVLYNLIFIIPLIAILLAVYGITTTGRVKKWWGGKEKILSLSTGVMILLLSVYLIFFF